MHRQHLESCDLISPVVNAERSAGRRHFLLGWPMPQLGALAVSLGAAPDDVGREVSQHIGALVKTAQRFQSFLVKLIRLFNGPL